MATDLRRTDVDAQFDVELQEWLESLDYVIQEGDPARVQRLLRRLRIRALREGIVEPALPTTPYINTIPRDMQPPYPGDLQLEARLDALVRWNAAVMVVRANRRAEGIGGHLSSFASAATLYEVAQNHFFHGPGEGYGGDQVYFQGHSAPGMYARAFLEGRLSEAQLENFRRELEPGGGLSSYPHPWLMPNFWQFPTVSMGLGPLMAIYQARMNRYIAARDLADTAGSRVWGFLGDGEIDEVEALGAIRLAARENLDNLTFIVNCNLQRLDGPVRGNGKVVQELEAYFRGAGWHVIKVLWGSEWDALFARDDAGRLAERLGEIVDGEFQKYTVEGGAYIRQHLFNDPYLQELASHFSDQELAALRPGGHDPEKVYAGLAAATAHKGQPTVVLAQTIKGYNLGPDVAARNVTHEQKNLTEQQLTALRTVTGVPVPDEALSDPPLYRPPGDAPEMRYLQERRAALGGYLPQRKGPAQPLPAPKENAFSEFRSGSDRPASTTMVFVRLLGNLLRDPGIGKRIVPIIPDEARTFGMEGFFRQIGIYSPVGQLYEPVDRSTLLPYKESEDGQVLEEGITEAGAMASFIAAATAGYTHGTELIPFYWFYSNFGLQRIGDLAWAAAELRSRGFLVGGLSGRTQLQGEGLQHQDGNSHLHAYPIPNLHAYDPAFAFEIAAIVKDGLRRMFEEQEAVYYYLTVGNENYAQLPMPEDDGVEAGIVRGLYLLRRSQLAKPKLHAQLLGSGAVLNEVLGAQEILAEHYGVGADVYSATSYKELYRDALEVERRNWRNPTQKEERPYVTRLLQDGEGPIVAASDYVKALPDSLARWMPRRLISLGTDGFGRSETRSALRSFFEVDARQIAFATLAGLLRDGQIDARTVQKAARELKIDPEKPSPLDV
ncbi:MAG: pyruvate dehydrogenase (acetyl-transferring), homodimeric type [Thermaerobacter sp.]|nr:pyruvate dehydrogenase (acetyl-transferring), homodimeric type [Thermaerobacter sp.]